MIVSSPVSVELTLPDTGASRTPAPRARTAGAIARIVSGRTVLMSTATAPARIPAGDAVRAVVQRADGGIVGDHRDDDVRAARRPRPALPATRAPIRSASAVARSGERL